jgi:hypothetical protein
MPYADDFADWIATEIRDPLLAERLAFPSPFDFADIEEFRQELVTILDEHLSRLPFTPRPIIERPFLFRRGHLTVIPLDSRADDLMSFRAGLAEVDESSIYYHVVEAAGRLGKPRGDFSAWIEDELGLPDVARQVRRVDPFVASLEQVRRRILTVLDAHLSGAGSRRAS